MGGGGGRIVSGDEPGLHTSEFIARAQLVPDYFVSKNKNRKRKSVYDVVRINVSCNYIEQMDTINYLFRQIV